MNSVERETPHHMYASDLWKKDVPTHVLSPYEVYHFFPACHFKLPCTASNLIRSLLLRHFKRTHFFLFQEQGRCCRSTVREFLHTSSFKEWSVQELNQSNVSNL